MAAVAAQFNGQVNFLGVSGRAPIPDMEQFLEDTGVGNMTHVADENGSIWQEFGVTSQPAFAFIDDDGSIQVSLGRQGQESLTAIAEELLAS